MPLSKQAIKKLRHDKKITTSNVDKRRVVREVLKDTRVKPTTELFKKTQAVLDKAVKTHILHKNKAARLKARLAKKLAKLGK